MRMAPRRARPRKTSAVLSDFERGKREGLAVDLLPLEGDEFVLFSWDVTPPAEAAGLTAAERAVLQHILTGASNEAIASARGTSTRTIANQVASLLRKTGASSRFDLIRRFAHAIPRAKT